MLADETTHLLSSSFHHDDDDSDNHGQSLQQQQQDDDLQNEILRLAVTAETEAVEMPPSFFLSKLFTSRHDPMGQGDSIMENRNDDSSLLLPSNQQEQQQQQQRKEQRHRVMIVAGMACCAMAGFLFGCWSTSTQQQQYHYQPVVRTGGGRGGGIRVQQQQQQPDFLIDTEESAAAAADMHHPSLLSLLQRRLNTDSQIDQWEDWKKQHAAAKAQKRNNATTATEAPATDVNSSLPLVASDEAAAAALWDGILRGISIPNDDRGDRHCHGCRSETSSTSTVAAAATTMTVVRFIDYSESDDAVERFHELTRYAPSSPVMVMSDDTTTKIIVQQEAAAPETSDKYETSTTTSSTSWKDKQDVLERDAEEKWHEVQQEVHDAASTWKAKQDVVESDAEEKWHEIREDIHNTTSTWKDKQDMLEKDAQEKWHEAENDAEEKWHQVQQQMHNVWIQLQNQSSSLGNHERTWWNQTAQNEQEWMQHVLQNLQSFGQYVSTWWTNATSQSKSREVQLQENFQSWWNQAHDEERTWWNHTRMAYSHFCQGAADKEETWWNATHQAMQHGWNATTHSAHTAWNVTSRSAQNTWNATTSRERQVLENAKAWFKSHVSYQPQLTNSGSSSNTPGGVSYFNSSRDYSHLMDPAYGWLDNSHDFFQIVASGWDAQTNQAYCAVASCTALLNSLSPTIMNNADSDKTNMAVVPTLPMDPVYSPYRYATQPSLMSSSCVNKHVIRYNESFDGIRRVPGGLSLNQAQKLLQCYLPTQYYDITVVHVNPSLVSLDEMRRDLYLALRDATARVVINFGRPALNQVGGGHFSPLVSYYRREDRFLILDVAKYKYPPVWVTAAQLYQAMSTLDVCGEWDYPSGQDVLYGPTTEENDHEDHHGGDHTHKNDNTNNDPLRYESNPQDYFQALHLLKCQTLHRGYIIVRPREISTPNTDDDNDNDDNNNN